MKRSVLVLIITMEAWSVTCVTSVHVHWAGQCWGFWDKECVSSLIFTHIRTLTCPSNMLEVRTLELDLVHFVILLVNGVFINFYWSVDALQCVSWDIWILVWIYGSIHILVVCIHGSHPCHLWALSRVLCAIQWVLTSYLLHTLFIHSNVYMNDLLRTVSIREN